MNNRGNHRIELLWLVLLAAIWGASFLFMRVAAPEFGPIPLIMIRVGVAALCFLPLLAKANNRKILREHSMLLLLVALFNSVIPFVLLSYATLSLEAGVTSLLNATTPLFAALVGLVWLKIELKRTQVMGLILGFAGIAVISSNRLEFSLGGAGFGIIAGLCATLSYGFAAHYTKRKVKDVPILLTTAGSMFAGAIVLIIPALWLWPEQMPSGTSWICALLLAVLCTAGAYLIYFRLIKHAGANFASTVTFIIPVFSIAWGMVFLSESITLRIVAGMLITTTGTIMTLRSNKRAS